VASGVDVQYYMFYSGGNPFINFDAAKYLLLNRTSNVFQFSGGSVAATGGISVTGNLIATGNVNAADINASGNVTVGGNQMLRWGALTTKNNMLMLYGAGTPTADSTNVYGLGVNPSVMRYNAPTGAAHVWYVNNTETMRIASTGHVGISVTPSAWISTVRAIQVGVGGSISTWDGSNGAVTLGSNWYDSGGATIRYINNAAAAYFSIADGAFAWAGNSAPPTGAGNAVTFATRMTLSSTGNLVVFGNINAVDANFSGDVAIGANDMVKW
jgi:hypothetical protein